MAALGILYIEAPISGGAAKANRGEMAMTTSGRPEAYAGGGSLLDAMAAKVYRLVCLGASVPEPLTEIEIDELRHTFGARW